jgi:hypothetical protein
VRLAQLPSGNYFIAVRHRNHLGIATLVPRFLTPNPAVVDFSYLATQTYGVHAQKVVNGANTLWPGDFNSDGKVVYQGPNNDIATLFFRIMLNEGNVEQLANFIVTGYSNADINLDGNTIYQGPGNDRSMLLLNATLISPANTNYLSNFVILQQMP